jgi:hypothetical protein
LTTSGGDGLLSSPPRTPGKDRAPLLRPSIRRAFEEQTMPEQACAARITELTRRLSELEARRAELAADQDDGPEALSDDDLRALQAHVHEVIENGDKPARKALLQALLEEIRVVSRAEIYPFFALPMVRPPYGSVPPAGFEPALRP